MYNKFDFISVPLIYSSFLKLRVARIKKKKKKVASGLYSLLACPNFFVLIFFFVSDSIYYLLEGRRICHVLCTWNDI